jgi:hypothetical protein
MIFQAFDTREAHGVLVVVFVPGLADKEERLLKRQRPADRSKQSRGQPD